MFHIFSYFFEYFILSLDKCLFKYFAHFKIQLSFCCWVEGFIYIFLLNCFFGKQSRSSSKIKHRVIIWPQNFTSTYIAKIIKNRFWHKNLHINIHSCLICNSQKAETLMPDNEWISKQKVVLYIFIMEYHTLYHSIYVNCA